MRTETQVMEKLNEVEQKYGVKYHAGNLWQRPYFWENENPEKGWKYAWEEAGCIMSSLMSGTDDNFLTGKPVKDEYKPFAFKWVATTMTLKDIFDEEPEIPEMKLVKELLEWELETR